jgi:hypothetical protein
MFVDQLLKIIIQGIGDGIFQFLTRNGREIKFRYRADAFCDSASGIFYVSAKGEHRPRAITLKLKREDFGTGYLRNPLIRELGIGTQKNSVCESKPSSYRHGFPPTQNPLR